MIIARLYDKNSPKMGFYHRWDGDEVGFSAFLSMMTVLPAFGMLSVFGFAGGLIGTALVVITPIMVLSLTNRSLGCYVDQRIDIEASELSEGTRHRIASRFERRAKNYRVDLGLLLSLRILMERRRVLRDVEKRSRHAAKAQVAEALFRR